MTWLNSYITWLFKVLYIYLIKSIYWRDNEAYTETSKRMRVPYTKNSCRIQIFLDYPCYILAVWLYEHMARVTNNIICNFWDNMFFFSNEILNHKNKSHHSIFETANRKKNTSLMWFVLLSVLTRNKKICIINICAEHIMPWRHNYKWNTQIIKLIVTSLTKNEQKENMRFCNIAFNTFQH